jgi:hypothetical protein
MHTDGRCYTGLQQRLETEFIPLCVSPLAQFIIMKFPQTRNAIKIFIWL